ncbi:hypothetical protein VP1G_02045 [Cytospora mali]|uniref:Uncharacterized protein n=1 Tax=Cytospora mali TaxID=578113 RepID=A0A194USH0_CYTMA|nr:hypothetical protein VP1G_02045 [Valsa mali var. pyri (nom. inval.)]
MNRSRGMDADTVLMVPFYDERQQGADLLMIPVSDNSSRPQLPEPQQPQLPLPQPQPRLPQPQPQLLQPQLPLPQPRPQRQQQQRHVEPPIARPPTPPPKPQLPLDCSDWDDYILWRRAADSAASSSTPASSEGSRRRRPAAAAAYPSPPTAPKEDILRGFEEWKEYLAASRAASRRGGRPISIISTSTTTTTGGRSFKRSSMCSISSTKSGKPRSLRRCSRSRHLRAYYSEGSLSTARNNQRGGEGSMKDAIVHIEHTPRGRPQLQPRQPGERRSRKRNRSLLDERERKRFHRVYWH